MLAKVVELVLARKRLAQLRLHLFAQRRFTFDVTILVSPAVTYFTAQRVRNFVKLRKLPIVSFTFAVVNL